MKEQAIYDLAMDVAIYAHNGQSQKGESGLPYIQHPIWVARQLGAAGYSIRTQAVGLMHDVIEDSEFTREDLLRLGFGYEILYPLGLLTKDPDLGYIQNVIRAGRNPRSRAVKRFDNLHNMDLARLGKDPSKKDIERVSKYGRSLTYLSTLGFPVI
jgi:guanosine-3',5'-bis(diphosphate) 3'-pyrophosphohydrolase